MTCTLPSSCSINRIGNSFMSAPFVWVNGRVETPLSSGSGRAPFHGEA